MSLRIGLHIHMAASGTMATIFWSQKGARAAACIYSRPNGVNILIIRHNKFTVVSALVPEKD